MVNRYTLILQLITLCVLLPRITSAQAQGAYSWNASKWSYTTGTGTVYAGMLVSTDINWGCVQLKSQESFTLTEQQKYLVIRGFILTGGQYNPNIYDLNGTSYQQSFKGSENGDFTLNTAGTLLYADLTRILPAAEEGKRTISSFGITLNADKQNLPVVTSIEFTDEIPDNEAKLTHPCMLHTADDIAQVKANLTSAPLQQAYSHLQNSAYAQSSCTEHTSALLDGYLKRMEAANWGPNGQIAQYSDYDNYTALMYDAAAAYQLALRYHLSGEKQYADAAVRILNAWKNNCKGLLRNDNYEWAIPDPNEYLILIQGHQMANAAELLRGYSGWQQSDFEGFKKWMRITFLDISVLCLVHRTPGQMTMWLNWDLAAMTSMLSVGILCDDKSIIDWVVNYFKNEQGVYDEVGNIRNAVPYLHQDPDSQEELGQSQESGRDQGHATLCVSQMGVFCQMAYNIGEDLFAYDDYRALKMAEYVGKYNLPTAETYSSGTKSFVYSNIPYTAYSNTSYYNPTLSSEYRGTIRPSWELFAAYARNHSQPSRYCGEWVTLMREKSGFGSDGGGGDYGTGSGGFDQLGYGTLMYGWVPERSVQTITDAKAATLILPFEAKIPEGVTAYTLTYSGGDVVTATEVTGAIAANTPVLLNAEAGDYLFVNTNKVAAATTGSGKYTVGALTGVYATTVVPVGSYILKDTGSQVGFAKVENGTTVKVDTHRAYLTATGATARSLEIDYSGTTGITVREDVRNKRVDGYYDIMGRKVLNPRKGLYIVNGKIVLK